jgi:hypothetical protein
LIISYSSLRALTICYRLIHENTQAPLLNLNELRVLLGLEAIEGGDVYMTNLNSKIIKDFSDLENEKETNEETN